MKPQSGSPAINSGNNFLAQQASLITDQRGLNRFVGQVDMGAVEVEQVTDGVGIKSLTTVLLEDQSGLDKNFKDHDVLLSSIQRVLKEKPESRVSVLADGSVRLTAFLPTDRAFRRLAFDLTGQRPKSDKQTMKVLNSLEIETLEKILLYHVILGEPITSVEVLGAKGLELVTLSGERLNVRVTKLPRVFLRDANKDLKNPRILLKRTDINIGNRQLAHTINRVLVPIENLKS